MPTDKVADHPLVVVVDMPRDRIGKLEPNESSDRFDVDRHIDLLADVVAHEGIGIAEPIVRLAGRIALTQPGFSCGLRIGASAEAVDGSAVGFSRRMAVSSSTSAKKA